MATLCTHLFKKYYQNFWNTFNSGPYIAKQIIITLMDCGIVDYLCKWLI